MRIDQINKYEVSLDEAHTIQNKMKELNATVIMDNLIMHRTIFFPLNSNGQHNWVRVRTGDIKLDGKIITAITFKKVTKYGSLKKDSVIDLEVEDYDSSIELMQEIGLQRKSKQETKRTKYFCEIDEDSFVICIDEWPWLQDYRIVAIQSIKAIEDKELQDMAKNIGIKNPYSYKESGGVDSIYEEVHEFIISDIPEVRFDLDVKDAIDWAKNNGKIKSYSK